MVSLTGGLLGLPKPLNQGARVSLMFMTLGGPVRGVAEMLKPQTWREQPFRFVSLHESDERKLRTLIQPTSKKESRRVPERATASAASMAPLVPQTLGLSAPLPSEKTSDPEQQWIDKYRAAVARNEERKPFLKAVLGHLQRKSN